MDNVCRCEEDKLYQSNAVCPKCHKAGYVYYLGNSKYVAVCTNCNYYMTKEDFPLWKASKTKTNADRIRTMTDEELAEWICVHYRKTAWCSDFDEESIASGKCNPTRCKVCVIDWLRKEVKE